MALMKRKIKIEPDRIYLCIESFAGERVSAKRGDRLRGTSEEVQLAPSLFVPDGSDDREIGKARAALQADYLDTPAPEDTHVSLPGPLVAGGPHTLVATADFRFDPGDGRSMAMITAGDLVDDRTPWVIKARKADPGLFKKSTASDQKAAAAS